jgi:hypothetical protein
MTTFHAYRDEGRRLLRDRQRATVLGANIYLSGERGAQIRAAEKLAHHRRDRRHEKIPACAQRAEAAFTEEDGLVTLSTRGGRATMNMTRNGTASKP